jgi:hypothetical protein
MPLAFRAAAASGFPLRDLPTGVSGPSSRRSTLGNWSSRGLLPRVCFAAKALNLARIRRVLSSGLGPRWIGSTRPGPELPLPRTRARSAGRSAASRRADRGSSSQFAASATAGVSALRRVGACLASSFKIIDLSYDPKPTACPSGRRGSDRPWSHTEIDRRRRASKRMSSRLRRALVAPDAFKGTYTAGQVAEAIAAGLARNGVTPALCPVADGGEGTLDVLLAARGGRLIEARARDPLGRPIDAGFGLLGRDRRVAVVEAAMAIGLDKLSAAERDPWSATSPRHDRGVSRSSFTASAVIPPIRSPSSLQLSPPSSLLEQCAVAQTGEELAPSGRERVAVGVGWAGDRLPGAAALSVRGGKVGAPDHSSAPARGRLSRVARRAARAGQGRVRATPPPARPAVERRAHRGLVPPAPSRSVPRSAARKWWRDGLRAAVAPLRRRRVRRRRPGPNAPAGEPTPDRSGPVPAPTHRSRSRSSGRLLVRTRFGHATAERSVFRQGTPIVPLRSRWAGDSAYFLAKGQHAGSIR